MVPARRLTQFRRVARLVGRTVPRAVDDIALTRGARAQINLRAATRLEPDYHLVLGEVRASGRIAADETGWRVGGHPAGLHAWVGDRATAYAIDPQRSTDALERAIGRDWAGVLSHDGFASYDRFEAAVHQQCVAHVLRLARDLLATATRGAVRFPRQVIALFTEAIHWRNGYVPGTWTDDQLDGQRVSFDDRLLGLVSRPRAVPEYATLARHLWNHLEQWFAFAFDPRIEPTNWKAEPAIRPAVVNRKVWGGNRTATGAKAPGVLMSVLETCRRQGRAVVDHISQTLRRSATVWSLDRCYSRRANQVPGSQVQGAGTHRASLRASAGAYSDGRPTVNADGLPGCVLQLPANRRAGCGSASEWGHAHVLE